MRIFEDDIPEKRRKKTKTGCFYDEFGVCEICKNKRGWRNTSEHRNDRVRYCPGPPTEVIVDGNEIIVNEMQLDYDLIKRKMRHKTKS